MEKPQPNELRARLRELLAIPDRDRSDAEWDELNELEILLAPGNREGARDPDPRRNGNQPMQHQRKQGGPPHGQGQGQGQPGGGKGHKRSRKRKGR